MRLRLERKDGIEGEFFGRCPLPEWCQSKIAFWDKIVFGKLETDLELFLK